jgi:hypothetical protein
MKYILTESQLKTVINEFSVQEKVAQIFSQNGFNLTPEEMEEISPDCPLEEPTEHNDLFQKIVTNIEGMNLVQLFKELKNLSSIKNKKQMGEQVGAAIIIAGVSVPFVAVAAIAGLIAIAIIVKIVKLIGGGRTKVRRSSACKRRNRLVRKFGMDGNFM